MSTFSYVGPKDGERPPVGEMKVTFPPIQVNVPPIEWQPILDVLSASQERSEFKADLLVAAIDELATNMRFPAPQVNVSPQVTPPAVNVEVVPEVKPHFVVPPAQITLRWPSGLVWAAVLNGFALLLVAVALGFQVYLRFK